MKIERLRHFVMRNAVAEPADQLGLDPHRVIKTLILQLPSGDPLCVLMHGDREVSLKRLARALGVKSLAMATPELAQRKSGYQVGGTSPFSTRKQLPIYMEKSITELETIYINGGKQGFLISISPHVVLELLKPTLVEVGIK